MAVKIWNLDESGVLTSTIRTGNRSGIGGEELRPKAEELDAEIDGVLDEAQKLLKAEYPKGRSKTFAKRWAIGRAIAHSRILDSPSLESGQKPDLWLAMARKCRIGIRNNGERVKNWKGLIPAREVEPQRIEKDVFGLAIWLQEQPLRDADLAFGSGIYNATEIWNGEALRNRVFRDSLAKYFAEYTEDERAKLYNFKAYATLAKTLRRRWPSRGKGSAKKPIHYSPEDLFEEVKRVLDPVATEILKQHRATMANN